MTDLLVRFLRPLRIPKYRLLDRLVPRAGTRAATIFTSRMNLDLSDLIQRAVYFGCYEPVETDIFRSVVRPGNVVVDAGANIGFFTALAASLVGPRGRVLAFEPNPTAFAALRRLCDENRLQHVSAFREGLSDVNEELTLYETAPGQHNLNSTMTQTPGYIPIPVSVRRLDEVLSQHNIDRVDLLKIDVEGHEPRVLAGAGDYFLDGRIRTVLLEFNQYWLNSAGSSPAALWSQLEDAGYREAGGRKVPAAADANYLFVRSNGPTA